MAADAAGLLLEVEPGNVEVTVEPHTEADSMIEQARTARAAADEANEHASKALRDAAQELLAEDFTVRDAGRLLGISPQRISQLTQDHLAHA